MMSDIQYEDYAQALIDKSLATYLSSHNSMKLSDDVVELVKQKDDTTLAAIDYWKQRLDAIKIERIKRNVNMSLIDIEDEDLKIIAAGLIADLNYRQEISFLRNSLEKYSINQPLFNSDNDLLTHTVSKNELIPSTLFQIDDRMANVVRFANGKYAYIDESLEPSILLHLKERGLTYYVRINPNYVYDNPSILHKREIWRAPSPKWKNAIGIKAHCTDGFSYYIPDEIDLKTCTSLEYHDRRILNIFRLEGFYERNGDGYFEMMVEELKKEEHPFLEKEYYIVGRMIHLDSIEDGEKGFDAKLKHIDLAINLYIDEGTAKSREEKRLVNRKAIVNVTPRSHILRLNNARLSDIIMFSTFFESKYLQEEWINGMFISDTNKAVIPQLSPVAAC